MIHVFDSVVAVGAIELGVDRFQEDVRVKERHRRHLIANVAFDRRVGVAVNAILIGRQRGGRPRPRWKGQ